MSNLEASTQQGARANARSAGSKTSRRSLLLGGASAALLSACSSGPIPIAQASLSDADLQGLAYNPVVYNLDLCILCYQLWAQTLVWPFDPFFEKHGNDDARNAFMAKARDWVRFPVARMAARAPTPAGYRGPGSLAGFANNPGHDPVLYRYDTLRPWFPVVSLLETTWTEQKPLQAISGEIRDVLMCYRPTGGGDNGVRLSHVASAGRLAARSARDVLIAFEGGTGDKGEPDQPASQSMLGFVLKRHIAGTSDYDIHIVFRGSRSGSAARAAFRALSTENAEGNPDWITDFGYRLIGPEVFGDISTVGKVHRGIAHSLRSALPKIRASLIHLAQGTGGRPPHRIYVTGHSMGAGLAQHFLSAVMLGDQFGPSGRGPAMPAELRRWPWDNVKLVTYSAPVCGDVVWARTMTEDILQSEFFDHPTPGITLTDPKALTVGNSEIALRLADPDRPAGYRILHPTDPVTTLRVFAGKHVGKTVYVASASPLGFADTEGHEPIDVRKRMIDALADPRLPETSWVYRDLAELSPNSPEEFTGSLPEFATLARAIERYYRTSGYPVDVARLADDFAVFEGLLESS